MDWKIGDRLYPLNSFSPEQFYPNSVKQLLENNMFICGFGNMYCKNDFYNIDFEIRKRDKHISDLKNSKMKIYDSKYESAVKRAVYHYNMFPKGMSVIFFDGERIVKKDFNKMKRDGCL